MKILFTMVVLFSCLYSIELDVKYLQQMVNQDEGNVEYRLLLSKHYFHKKNFSQSLKLVDEALEIDPYHVKAKELKKTILRSYNAKLLFKEYGVDDISDEKQLSRFFDKLYKKKENKLYLKMYDLIQSRGIKSSYKTHLNAVWLLIENKEYQKAKKILDSQNFKQNAPFIELNALLCEKLNQKACVKKAYQKLWTTYNEEKYGVKLFEIYYQEKDINKANKLYQQFKKTYSTYKMNDKLKELNLYAKDKAKKEFVTKDSFDSLKIYAFTLFDMEKKRDSITVVKNFLHDNPQHIEAKILLSKLLYWSDEKDEAKTFLKEIVETNDNLPALDLYAQILYEQARYQEVIQYFDRLIQLQTDLTKKEQYREKLRFCKNNIKTDTQTKQLEIADRYYFDKKYNKSLYYYKIYLSENPKDNKIHYRYALALEHEQKYKDATKEFYKLAQIANDPKQHTYVYHYGFSLLKSGDRKKAQRIFKGLIKIVDKSKPLYKYTKNALRVASRPQLKPTRHKDIMLFEGAKKSIDPSSAFSKVYAKKSNLKTTKSILPSSMSYDINGTRESLTFGFEYMSSSDKTNIKDYTIGFDNITFVDDWNIGLRLGNYLSKSETLDFNANKLEIVGTSENLQASLGVNSFDDFLEFHPALTYTKKINNHDLSFNYSYQNGTFYKYDPIMISEKISTNHFSISDTVSLEGEDKLNLNLEINQYSDKNTQFLPIISVPLYENKESDVLNTISLYSKLNYNTENNSTYHTIQFEDFNTFEFKSKHKLSNSAYFLVGGGLGYSFEQEEPLFTAQINISYPMIKSLSLFANCIYIDSAKQYDMVKCNAFASYAW